jgi:hypothetical protein
MGFAVVDALSTEIPKDLKLLLRIEAVIQVFVEKYRANKRLELVDFVMVTHVIVVHEIDFAPMRLELYSMVKEMIP